MVVYASSVMEVVYEKEIYKVDEVAKHPSSNILKDVFNYKYGLLTRSLICLMIRKRFKLHKMVTS